MSPMPSFTSRAESLLAAESSAAGLGSPSGRLPPPPAAIARLAHQCAIADIPPREAAKVDRKERLLRNTAQFVAGKPVTTCC